MTENLCACGRPSRDATICAGCGFELDAAIAEICEPHGLAYDLDIALTRQARLGDRNGSRPTETSVPYDKRASDAGKHLKGVLVGWARLVAEELGIYSDTNRRGIGPTCRRCDHASCRAIPAIPQPPDNLAGLATWLRPRVGWMRHHPAGAEAHDEILDAVKRARRVCDRPAEKIYAGPCDCGEDLYARLGAPYVTCRGEAHDQPILWEVEARRVWLLESARDVLATTTEISRALTRYSKDVSPSAIRGYVKRDRLVAKGERSVPGRKDPLPLYKLGDVLDILARQAERVSA